jgi:hypothetical protein
LNIAGAIALKGLGVAGATPRFAFGSFNGLTFAFFYDSGLMFDMPTTAFLSLSHNPSFFVRSASHS